MTTLAFTRPLRRLEESVAEAEEMGFDVVASPSLDIIHGDPVSYKGIREKLRNKEFGMVIFSSATAVEECHSEWDDEFASMIGGTEVIAIGPGTSRLLRDMGIEVTSIPKEYTSSGLVDHLKGSDRKDVLIVHSDKGSTVLRDGLESSGFKVEELVAYTLDKHKGGLDRMRSMAKGGRIDVFAFTSRMSVESFFDSIGMDKDELFARAKVAAIGPPTRERLEEEGVDVDIMPANATFKELLQVIKDCFEKEISE